MYISSGAYKSFLQRFLLILLISGSNISLSYAQDKVVYHIENAKEQATQALRSIRNHLDTAPDTKIIVVAHAYGIDFLMNNATDQKNQNIVYEALVADLRARGVTFEICEITLKRRKLSKELFILDANFTKSGVVRITQLQTREGYAYLKP